MFSNLPAAFQQILCSVAVLCGTNTDTRFIPEDCYHHPAGLSIVSLPSMPTPLHGRCVLVSKQGLSPSAQKLLTRLDDDEFDVREQASQELHQLPGLDQFKLTMLRHPSLEVCMRLADFKSQRQKSMPIDHAQIFDREYYRGPWTFRVGSGVVVVSDLRAYHRVAKHTLLQRAWSERIVRGWRDIFLECVSVFELDIAREACCLLVTDLIALGATPEDVRLVHAQLHLHRRLELSLYRLRIASSMVQNEWAMELAEEDQSFLPKPPGP